MATGLLSVDLANLFFVKGFSAVECMVAFGVASIFVAFYLFITVPETNGECCCSINVLV